MSIPYRALTVLTAGSVVMSTSAVATTQVVRPAASPVFLVATVQVSSIQPTAKYGVACVAGAATAATASAAGTAQQAIGRACLLPVSDVQPPATTDYSAIPASNVASGGLGFLPVLLGLVAVAGAIALLASGGDGDDDRDAVSPG